MESDPQARETELQQRVRQGENGGFSKTLTALCRIAPPAGDELEVAVRTVRAWAQQDVAAAAAWVGSAESGTLRQRAYEQVAVAWVAADLPQALDWARTLPIGDADAQMAVRQVAFEVARTQPLDALQLTLDLAETTPCDGLIRHVTLQWAAIDPAAAAVWADQTVEPALRASLLSAVATVWADRNPVIAAELAVLALEPGREQDNAVVGVVQRWTQCDPEAAAEWVAGFPQGPLSNAAVESMLPLLADTPL